MNNIKKNKSKMTHLYLKNQVKGEEMHNLEELELILLLMIIKMDIKRNKHLLT